MGSERSTPSVGRRVGYLVAALVNVVLVWAASRVDEWFPGLFSGAYGDVLSWVTASLWATVQLRLEADGRVLQVTPAVVGGRPPVHAGGRGRRGARRRHRPPALSLDNPGLTMVERQPTVVAWATRLRACGWTT